MPAPRGRAGPTRSCRPLGRRGGGAGALCSWCGRPGRQWPPAPIGPRGSLLPGSCATAAVFGVMGRSCPPGAPLARPA